MKLFEATYIDNTEITTEAAFSFVKVVLDQVVAMVGWDRKATLAELEDQEIQEQGDLPDYEEIREGRGVLVLMAHQEIVDYQDLQEREVGLYVAY